MYIKNYKREEKMERKRSFNTQVIAASLSRLKAKEREESFAVLLLLLTVKKLTSKRRGDS